MDLHIQRAVAEISTSLYTFGASVAKVVIDRIFKIWLFNKFPVNSACRAKLVFRSGADSFNPLPQVSAAEVAISAHLVRMGAFRCRWGENTIGLALTALCAF
jgi:hypothetical protein